MCGRARCTLRADDFPRACNLNSRPVRHVDVDRYRPSYNVAPGFNVPVVRRDNDSEDGVILHCMKWGLIPSFTKKTEKPDHFRMFNARSESIREKAYFRRLLPNNRCLVSVEGFYEWKKDGSKKQPYYIHFKDGRPLVFAALFDSWKNPEGEIVFTFTIVTTSSSSSLEWLHDRMPVIMGNKETSDMWLLDSSMSNLEKILKPYEEADLVWYPVTPAMGKLSFDGSDCIKEIQVKREENKSISQFFSKKEIIPEDPTLEMSTTKEEHEETTIQPKAIKDESKLDITITKDGPGEAKELEIVKEEWESNDGSKNNQNNIKSDKNSSPPKAADEIKVKRDFEEFSADAKPFVKEFGMQNSSAAGKRSKGAIDNKQPTLFSYFGKR